jgi:hypothetical protein
VKLSAFAAALLWHAVVAVPAGAHALDPVLFELQEELDGKVAVTWKASNARVPGLDLVPILPPECKRVGVPRDQDEQDVTISHWVLDCGEGGLVGRTVGIQGLESTDALLRIVLKSGAVDRRVLGAAHPTVTVAGEPTRWGVLRDYARLGIGHIAGGLDYLLFVFGLMLLTGGTRALLPTITAFMVGHSVTLALAALEIVRVPQGYIEILIAVTIYLLAVELARDVADASTLLRRRPWAMAFTFGLLHGLGFAGALRATGLPANDVPFALLSFNLGIEIGQLGFVVLVLATTGALHSVWGHRPERSRVAAVYAMGVLASYWTIARTAALF